MEVKVMNEFLKGLKVNYTVSALVCVALGLVLLIWPGTTTQVVCMVLGAALVIYGVLQIVFYFLISHIQEITDHCPQAV